MFIRDPRNTRVEVYVCILSNVWAIAAKQLSRAFYIVKGTGHD